MPNWVECTLEIAGAPDVVADCLASMGSPGHEDEDARLFDFDRVIPVPQELRERLEAPGPTVADWSDWWWQMTSLWGTKWNADHVAVDRQPGGGMARVSFRTAWAPPRPVIEVLADRFPGLKFDFIYFDQQAPIAGRALRTPGEGWATIDATFDDGFCLAAVGAQSGHWDPSDDELSVTPEVPPARM